jgi:hypothetical protein
MSCSINSNNLITWKISKDLINRKLESLLYLKHESAGEFVIDNKTKSAHSEVTILPGKKDSVYSPNAILNYHTHPISCYLQEGTVLGYLSGEDIRETLVFGLMGSIGHVVLTVEGTYMLQVSPCILENLIKLGNHLDHTKCPAPIRKKGLSYVDFMRGVIILVIEMYFRSAHVFRSRSYNRYRKISPADYVEYVEAFRLNHIFAKGHSNTNINSYGITTFVKGADHRMPYLDYIRDYESNTEVDMISSTGVRNPSGITVTKCLKMNIFDQLKGLKLDKQCTRDNGRWSDKWFTASVCYNEVTYNGQRVMYHALSVKDQHEFLVGANNQSNITVLADPAFFFYDMNGLCNYKDIKKDLEMASKEIKRKHSRFGNYDEDDSDDEQDSNSDEVHDSEDQDEDRVVYNDVDDYDYDTEGQQEDEYDEDYPEEGQDVYQNRGSLGMSMGEKRKKVEKKSRKKTKKTAKKTKKEKKTKITKHRFSSSKQSKKKSPPSEYKGTIILFGSESCPYCVKSVNDIKKSNYKLDKRYESDIGLAIDAANTYARKHGGGGEVINSIPALFMNSKYIDRYSIKDINWT